MTIWPFIIAAFAMGAGATLMLLFLALSGRIKL